MPHLQNYSSIHKKAREHRQRWLTALIAAPALILLIGYGSPSLFAGLIAVVSLFAAYEYSVIVLGENSRLEMALLLAASPAIVMAFHFGKFPLIIAILMLAMMAAFAFSITRVGTAEGQARFNTERPMSVIFGIVYIPLALAHIVGLRAEGIAWVFFVIVFPMIGDTAAFYIGRKWGRKKLSPLISPHKSVVGLVAIPFGALIGGSLFAHFFLTDVPFYHIAIITIVGSLLGQTGDLCESLLKRARGLKDSGFILPGHGGVLDRLDCLLFVFPFVYYYKAFLIG